ncbi:hypothetical protein CWC02_08380, partial [Pseudoalteromonas sp. S2721]
LNNEIFALLSTRFYCLKIDYLIKRIGITRNDYEFYSRLPHIYCFGFYPWLTNYQEVAVSSSTSTLDFIIIPVWATLYGAGFVVLHEIALGVARAFNWGR